MPEETLTTNSDDFDTTRYIGLHGPLVTRGRSKTSKTRSFDGRTRFCAIPIVTLATPGTVDVRISDAA